ncbi:dTDP-4-dehydrorhamnose reductase [Daejeonella rubra]|uniref:dTDP-4-dehydrorhamnose reductase n=1 Tax=Daejeonella rubra TaxID=990371 RepID=A0A1G9WWE3_9SPHI|nr:SDR family oxidoreductase [Daejeonella rubra]SDM88934.1 dTDP-4-dehydrorhamnose reductase [Daejeonella rubra]
MEQVRKVLILGSKGMAGHVIRQVLLESGKFEVIDIARDETFFKPSFLFDLSDLNKLENILKSEAPDVVINCIGILNEAAESNVEESIFFNSYLPHFVAARCKKLIHISTDCVFNGKRGGYTESDFKDGNGFYAQTKALGEVTYRDHLTIRTSIVGPELKQDGIGLFHWFMRQNGEIKGYTKAFWSGVTTLQLAKSILEILSLGKSYAGLLHLTNNQKISKFELLSIFSKVMERPVIIQEYDQYFVDKSLLNTRNDFPAVNLSFEDMVSEQKEFIENHPDFYAQYIN